MIEDIIVLREKMDNSLAFFLAPSTHIFKESLAV